MRPRADFAGTSWSTANGCACNQIHGSCVDRERNGRKLQEAFHRTIELMFPIQRRQGQCKDQTALSQF